MAAFREGKANMTFADEIYTETAGEGKGFSRMMAASEARVAT